MSDVLYVAAMSYAEIAGVLTIFKALEYREILFSGIIPEEKSIIDDACTRNVAIKPATILVPFPLDCLVAYASDKFGLGYFDIKK